MGYKITKENYKAKTYLWDAELEVYLALFCKRLEELRPKHYKRMVAKEILTKYVRKSKSTAISATKIMREMWGEK